MRASLFWFDDEQWAKIEPLLPTNQRGPARKDDRRILSGIMHVVKTRCRRVDCPPEYGPHKTIYNRINRWSARRGRARSRISFRQRASALASLNPGYAWL
jgi:transposase